jgi:hypothetical protein
VTAAKVRPLSARPGARFACAGDGLCCTDLHALGPLTRDEVVHLRVYDPDPSTYNEHLKAPVLRTTEAGWCRFLGPAGCALHAAHGAEAKPASCRRFPYRLVATPLGGRVCTEHRCPCRTLGDRPALDLADAERSLRSGAGRLQADARAPARIRLTRARRVAFTAYASMETVLLERLAAGEDPARVLDAEPFPALQSATWADVGHLFRSRLDGTACSVALAWFGDMLLAREGHVLRSMRDRPWRFAFDRAEARAPVAGSSEAVLADWVADALYGLDWIERGAFDAARADLATRLTIARDIVAWLCAIGARPDRAAAEAVAIVELAGISPLFGGVVAAMRLR